MFFSLRFWYLLLLSSKGQGKILKKNLRKFNAIKKIDKNEDWMQKNDAGMFEGDIMLEGGAKRAHLDTKGDPDENVAVHNARKYHQWTLYGHGVIPYVISGNFSKDQREAIQRAFKEYHDKTCIKFVQRDSSKHDYFIDIMSNERDNVDRDKKDCIKRRGCWSSVGWSKKDCKNKDTKHVGQKLNLDNGCVKHKDSPGM